MENYLAGTVIRADIEIPGAAREKITPLFTAGGLILSQVCDLMGIEYYNVQNWVKRGFVSPPQNKRYTERQFCRLVIINAFKDILEMKDIVAFISYINGSLSDESDDLLADDELYFCFTDAVAELCGKPLTEKITSEVCERAASGYPTCSRRLYNVLKIMVDAYFSGVMRSKAVDEIKRLNGIIQ